MLTQKTTHAFVLTSFVAVLVGCSGNEPASGVEDPGASNLPEGNTREGDLCAGELADEISASAEAFQALSASTEGGDTYWYEEENVAAAGFSSRRTLVQVTDGQARTVKVTTESQSDAGVIVNRYPSFEPRTFEELYAVCQALAAKSCETSVRTDALAVIESCTWPGESDCADACGEGFHLRRGEAPGK